MDIDCASFALSKGHALLFGYSTQIGVFIALSFRMRTHRDAIAIDSRFLRIATQITTKVTLHPIAFSLSRHGLFSEDAPGAPHTARRRSMRNNTDWG